MAKFTLTAYPCKITIGERFQSVKWEPFGGHLARKTIDAATLVDAQAQVASFADEVGKTYAGSFLILDHLAPSHRAPPGYRKLRNGLYMEVDRDNPAKTQAAV